MATLSTTLLHSLLLIVIITTLLSSTATSAKPVFFASVAASNPFAAKATALRYWSRRTPQSTTRPDFLVSKLSPLSALDSATYSHIAASSPGAAALSARLPAFCAAARLLCAPSLASSSHPGDSNFAKYQNINFTNYATDRAGGLNTFKNYSDGLNVPTDTFRTYARGGAGSSDAFAHYSPDGNVVTDNFTSYGTSGTGGTSDFTNYDPNSNVPNLKFTNYAAHSNGHTPTFTSYADNTNSGDQSFAGYGKDGNGVPVTFKSYANNSNVINSGFSGYGEGGNGAADDFKHYGDDGNVPENTFRNYGADGNAGTDTFTSYRDDSNVGDDNFQSYAKKGLGSAVAFTGYGGSFNTGNETFKGYGEGATDPNVTFKSYSSGGVPTFKTYAKSGVTFKGYHNTSTSVDASAVAAAAGGGGAHHHMMMMSRWAVQPGRFFRERSLTAGTVMPMPDITDKMPARSFLPRSIAGRIPFSAAGVAAVFGFPADTAMGKAVADTVAECGRAPSKGETKRCATSAEDVIDFAAEVLGGGAVARSTESTRGGGGDVIIGKVTGIDGGKVTRSVSCHQSLFPYLVYYCHSVPQVRVYEAEILAVDSKEKINHGVAICHIDTSDWAPGHGAFVALGDGPGKIEVCHWIFEGDMTWTGDGVNMGDSRV